MSATAMRRELDVFESQFLHPFHQRTWLGQHDNLVTAVADRPGQLNGVEL